MVFGKDLQDFKEAIELSIAYHSYDVNGVAQNELVAGAYAEHTGTLGGDESLSTISRNWVENRTITNRILQDESTYLLKTEAETKYAVEYVNATPATIRDKIYSVNGNFYAGDSTNSTLHELGKVKTVNNQSADSNGNVAIEADDIPTTTTGVTVQDALDAVATKAYVQGLYPVGTIYMNDVATTVPFDFGTWDLIDGKFLYGCASDFSDIGTTGGNATVTLGTNHFPTGPLGVNFPAITGSTGNVTNSGTTWTHSHVSGVLVNSGQAGNAPWGSSGTYSGTRSGQETNGNWNSPNTNSTNLQHTHSFSIPAQTLSVTINSGTQDSFSVIPPYKKVAIWHRTA